MILSSNIYCSIIIGLNLYRWFPIGVMLCNFISIIISLGHIWVIIYYDKPFYPYDPCCSVAFDLINQMALLLVLIFYMALLSRDKSFIICELVLFVIYLIPFAILSVWIVAFCIWWIFTKLSELFTSTIQAINNRNNRNNLNNDIKSDNQNIKLDDQDIKLDNQNIKNIKLDDYRVIISDDSR